MIEMGLALFDFKNVGLSLKIQVHVQGLQYGMSGSKIERIFYLS